jgi:hypothetical protein
LDLIEFSYLSLACRRHCLRAPARAFELVA